MWNLRASNEPTLARVSGAIHDAYVDGGAIKHDLASATLVIPFAQEGWPSGPQPDRRLLGQNWRSREYEVAFFSGTLTIRDVRHIVQPDGWDEGMLRSVKYASDASELRLYAAGCLRTTVDALDVEVAISQEVALLVRRRIGRFTRISADRVVAPSGPT